ncbi:MAG: prepilin-type N-terminal cleavage/methylation domain-containing protein, partial [Planctomycetes bacterium]|nr:prepilin-type N-terminal cleavage/methylation domain-containing protein [Planctomycetota bacterium]
MNDKNINTSAYTLAECMIVVAILGLLSALLLPIAFTVYNSAMRVMCTSNLRQVGICCQLYSSEHGQHFPAEG